MNFLDTVPLIIFIFLLHLKVEHRLTKLETLLKNHLNSGPEQKKGGEKNV